MTETRPIYKKLLVAAIAVFVIGVSLLLADLCYRVERIEHKLMHASGQH